MRGQNGFDIAQLDAITTQLDLLVQTAEILDFAIRQITCEIARLIKPASGRIGSKRMRHKSFGCKRRPIVIGEGQTVAANVKLPRHSERHRLQVLVEQVDLRVCNRTADGDVVAVLIESLQGGPDSCLGWPIEVPDFRASFSQLLRKIAGSISPPHSTL